MNSKKKNKKIPKMSHQHMIAKSTNTKLYLYQVLKERHANHIYFYEPYLDNNSVNRLRSKIHAYNHFLPGNTINENMRVWSDPNPIVLHIHCPGGDMDAGFSAMKLIYKSKIPIITIIDGLVASAATFMCLISKLRLMNPHGYMLIHQPSNTFSTKGQFNTIEDKYIRIKKYMLTLKKIYKKYSNLDEKTLNNILSNDIYMDAQTCKKNGLIDRIMD